ncbi:MAG: hypothetical protein ACFFDN_42755 [Candidatus Hodarchaeota archaeon]
MNLDKFNSYLEKMQKERILRMHEIVFELYSNEQNKANVSKKLKFSPQTIGPDLDLLEEVKIIRSSRVEHRKGIPSTYYITDIQSILKGLKIPKFDVCFQLLFKLKPFYAKIKELEQKGKEFQMPVRIFPLGSEIFLLQFLGSLLVLAAIIFHPHIKFYESLSQDLPFDFEKYNSIIRTHIPEISDDIKAWITQNSKEINEIYEFVWNNLYRKFFRSILKESSLTIINGYKASQDEKIKEHIQTLKAQNLFYGKVNLNKMDDLIDYERNIRQRLYKGLNESAILIQKAMKKTLDDKETLNKLDSIRSEITKLRNDIRKSIISQEKNREIANIKLQIIMVLLVESTLFLKLCNEVNNEINSSNWENVPIILREIISNLSKINNLLMLQQNIMIKGVNVKNIASQLESEFKLILGEFYAPLKKDKLKKKEYYKKLSEILLSIGEAIQAEMGGIILLSELYQFVKKKYPQVELEVEDLKVSLKNLKDDKLILGLKKLKSGIELVRFYPSDVSGDMNKVLELATELGQLNITDVMNRLNWTHERSQMVLEDLVNNKIAKKSSKYSEGEIWYFPGLEKGG